MAGTNTPGKSEAHPIPTSSNIANVITLEASTPTTTPIAMRSSNRSRSAMAYVRP